MHFQRSSGVLLHPTSLPSKFGIGDLGQDAFDFIDFLVESEQSMWQVLPLGPTGYADSPYQCLSAFAGNPLLVSPSRLVQCGLLSEQDIRETPGFPAGHVDFGAAILFKESLLQRAFENFKRSNDNELHKDYLSFTENEKEWLDDYALFRALKQEFGGVAWNDWPEPFRNGDEQALQKARDQHHDSIDLHKFSQYLFFKQWKELKDCCEKNRIKIIGDLPIFVAYDSVDVWSAREIFKLNPDGNPKVVAGVPPDYFSATGQLWGNPIYDWDEQRKDGFSWWVRRVKKLLETCDCLRIDHFRGFAASYEIPYGDVIAQNGRFVEAPGRAIFKKLKDELGDLPIIAEDLGTITPDVVALRDEFGFPGMRILQMAFRDRFNPDLPHNYVPNCVVYTGTHDHDTAKGWFTTTAGADTSTRDQEEINKNKQFCLAYLNTKGAEIHWDFIRAALASVGQGCIIPMQDLLGLGSEARMNRPSVPSGNWIWRYEKEQLRPEIAHRLKELTKLYCRSKTPGGTKSCYGY